METRRLLIALNAAERLHRAALCRLAETPDRWLDLRPGEIAARAARLGVTRAALERALEIAADGEALADTELAGAEALGCVIVTRGDVDYPRDLLDLPLPPPVLYQGGRLPLGPAVAMVGSRKMSRYGERAAKLFARRLAEAGVTVVSGFARGVDTAAHTAALGAEGGTTVAVLGCGLDVDYPRGSAALRHRIAENGAVLSEFPLGSQPLPWRFPIRNRVIAGLTAGVLVVQAAPRSGSLITAHLALDLGRDIYAVPGSIFDDLAEGTHALIADGALIARTPDDVLDALPLALQQQLFPDPRRESTHEPAPAIAAGRRAEGFAKKVLDQLPASEPSTAEDLARRLDQPVDRVLAALLELELGGWLRRLPGPTYSR